MKSDDAARAEECRGEYLALRKRIGRAPLVSDMQQLAPGLYPRISKLMEGVGAFRARLRDA